MKRKTDLSDISAQPTRNTRRSQCRKPRCGTPQRSFHTRPESECTLHTQLIPAQCRIPGTQGHVRLQLRGGSAQTACPHLHLDESRRSVPRALEATALLSCLQATRHRWGDQRAGSRHLKVGTAGAGIRDASTHRGVLQRSSWGQGKTQRGM